jgi:hypothetical protein
MEQEAELLSLGVERAAETRCRHHQLLLPLLLIQVVLLLRNLQRRM